MYNDLTIFLVSSGKNPNYDDCLTSLRNQSVDWLIRYVKDVSPMSKAFQTMVDRCPTKYFVQCDHDMILDRDAIEKLYNKIQKVYKEVAILGCMLYDPHLDKNIYGVKIYNRDIIKNYPYKDSLSCEVDQIKEFEKDGYRFHFDPEVIGKHSPKWTKEIIYERYFNLMEKFKQYKYSWLQKIPQQLFQKVQKNPTEENIYALLGAYTSISQKNQMQNKEKDFHSLKRVELGRFESYFKFPTTANLYISNVCNFKCTFCLRQSNEIEKHPEMTPELCGKLLQKFPTIKSVCIAGFAEPLATKCLFPIMRFLKQRGIFIGLITNGSLIKQNLVNLKNCKPNYISVSLNASNAKDHKEITLTDTFEKVKEGIKLLSTLDIPIYVSTVVGKNSISDVPEVLKLAKELGVKGVDLHGLLPHAFGKDKEWFENNVLKEEDKELVDKLRELKDSTIIRSYPILVGEKPLQSCTSPWKTIGLNGNGSISLCSAVLPPDKKFGNISDDSPWFGEECIKFRDGFLENKNDICGRCFRNFVK